MPNVALIIGISEYKNLGALSACKFDALRMNDLLLATKKYDDIRCIVDSTDTDKIKEEIRLFFEKHAASENSIDEAFVFISGHGTYSDDALFCCSDFDPDKPKSTSISSSELDDLLRSVGSNVAVKVIDACHSGSTYIKDSEESFEKALEPKGAAFKSFICMASSRQDQKSYAVAHESKFTASWMNAALQKDSGTVLYRDIKAALADAFSGNPKQTPHFVDQGSGLEKFCQVTEEMRQLKTSNFPSAQPTETKESAEDYLLTAVKSFRANPIAKNAAIGAIDSSAALIGGAKIADEVVSAIYEISCDLSIKLKDLPKKRAIAEFAHQGGWDKKYFVEIDFEDFKERVRKQNIFSTMGLLTNKLEPDVEYTTRVVRKPSGLRSTDPLPFEAAAVTFAPRNDLPLKAFRLYLGVVQSKAEVAVLSATCSLSDKSWDRREPDISELTWKSATYPWREVVGSPTVLWEEALRHCEAEVRAYLTTVFAGNSLVSAESK